MLTQPQRFEFGGPPQWALVRGRADAPVLLLVQAGPGLPMIQEADAIERALRLQESFRVVHWDQRGTGKSFSAKDKEPIALETSVNDIRSMVRALYKRLNVEAIDVVGFSFGGSLSLLACEDDSLPVRSITCVGIDVDLLANERFALEFALREADRRRNARARRALEAIGPAPHPDAKRFMERVKWVSNFGGVHRHKDFGAIIRGTVARLWSSPSYARCRRGAVPRSRAWRWSRRSSGRTRTHLPHGAKLGRRSRSERESTPSCRARYVRASGDASVREARQEEAAVLRILLVGERLVILAEGSRASGDEMTQTNYGLEDLALEHAATRLHTAAKNGFGP